MYVRLLLTNLNLGFFCLFLLATQQLCSVKGKIKLISVCVFPSKD